MPNTVLLTLGRLPKGLDLARSFRRAGYRVIVADPFRWHLMRVSNTVARSYQVTAPAIDPERYLEDLVRIIKREAVDLVVPVSEEVLHVAALKERLASDIRVYTMSLRDILALHNKHVFIQKAGDFGLDVPETHRLNTAGATDLASRKDTIVKPVFSCAGSGVRFLPKGTDLPSDDPSRPAIVQAHLNGDPISSFSIVHNGRVQLTTLYRGIINTGTVAIGFERIDDRPEIDAWIETFVDGTGHDGFIAFDFIVDRSGRPFAIECNPRVTSGVHFVATDSLAPMMLYPQRKTPPRRRVDQHLQQFWPCLTETQASIFRPRRFVHHLRHLIRSRDVSWRRRDPLPFLLMPFTSLKMLWMAMTTELSLGEAATRDIEWVPEAARPRQDDVSIKPTEASPGT